VFDVQPDRGHALGVDVHGRPVVVKSAPPGPGADRLRREARVLAAARHPGVVDLVDLVDAGGGVSLRTRHAGSRTLATCGRLPVEDAAGVISALAATLADLHAIGIAHGRIGPEHVLLTASGRPVLCGLADATLPGASHPACGPTPADDVAALGSLLSALVGDGPEVELIPERRGLRPLSTRRAGERRALLTLADHAAAHEPARRPTAAQLAAAVRDALPQARLPALSEDAADTDRDHPGPRRPDARIGRRAPMELRPPPGRRPGRHRTARPPTTTIAARIGLIAIGLLLLGVAVARPGARPALDPATIATGQTASVADAELDGDPAGHARPRTGGGTPLPAVPAPPADPAPGVVTLPAPGADPTGHARPRTGGGTPLPAVPAPPADPAPGVVTLPAPGADPTTPDPDHWSTPALGCASDPAGGPATLASGVPCPVEVGLDAGALRIVDREFDLGQVDGVVGIGDFACASQPRAVVLLTDTGDIAAFDDWAEADRPVTGRVIARIDDARRLVVEPRSGGACHRLVALDGWGIRHLVDVTAAGDAGS